MKSLTSIKNFKEGKEIQGFFLCVEKKLRHTRKGDLYIDIELRDITGYISAKIWDNVETLNKKFETGNAVVVYGTIENFLDRLQLIIHKINKATVQHYGRYGFDPAKIVKSSKKIPDKMWSDLGRVINSIKDKNLRNLISIIYKKNKKKVMYHPASINLNHNYRSGLLEHILTMANIAKRVSQLYNVNKDLVLAGVLLHQIGRVNEINSEYQSENTLKGNLIGHDVIGRDILFSGIKRIKKFPKDLSEKLEHIILSYRGHNNSKYSVKPSFPEALLVHHIHLMDKQMNLMGMSIDEDSEIGRFTNRHNYFQIPILKNHESK